MPMGPKYKRMLAGMQRNTAAEAPPAERWYLYILRCIDGSFYTGITKDLERRFKQHNTGKASRYTRTRLPVEILYTETLSSHTEALVRECKVKDMNRKTKEKLVMK